VKEGRVKRGREGVGRGKGGAGRGWEKRSPESSPVLSADERGGEGKPMNVLGVCSGFLEKRKKWLLPHVCSLVLGVQGAERDSELPEKRRRRREMRGRQR